jgi:hypothetical protein
VQHLQIHLLLFLHLLKAASERIEPSIALANRRLAAFVSGSNERLLHSTVAVAVGRADFSFPWRPRLHVAITRGSRFAQKLVQCARAQQVCRRAVTNIIETQNVERRFPLDSKHTNVTNLKNQKKKK